jgi:hypothetical protein
MKRGVTVPQVLAQFQQKSWRRSGGQELCGFSDFSGAMTVDYCFQHEDATWLPWQ